MCSDIEHIYNFPSFDCIDAYNYVVIFPLPLSTSEYLSNIVLSISYKPLNMNLKIDLRETCEKYAPKDL